MSDAVYIWIGWAVVTTIGLAGTAALIVGVSTLAVLIGTAHLKKIGNVAQNLSDMKKWRDAGKPKWKFGPDNVARMTPTEDPTP